METPKLLRISILLGVLTFCAVWWAQMNYFDFRVDTRAKNTDGVFKVYAAWQFSVSKPEGQKEDPLTMRNF